MRLFSSVTIFAVSGAFLTLPAFAQQVISARSGVVQYVEGDVTAGSEILNPKSGEFPALKKNEVLRTQTGRAEVLLTPGVFLRMGENSSIRMVANSLSDTQVEFIEGAILVEATDFLKDNSVSILYNGVKATLQKNGLYRFDGQPARVGVYSGEVEVAGTGKTIAVKGGHQARLTDPLSSSSFDNKLEEDALYRWSSRRSDYVAMANVSAARQIQDSGRYYGSSLWAFNPWFGMYTYVPYGGSLYSPFGFGYYSPFDAMGFYNMYPYYYGGYGYPWGYYPSGGGSGGGGKATARNSTPYTSRQLGYSTGSRTSGVGVAGRSSGGVSSHSGGGAMASPSSGGSFGVGRSSGGFSSPASTGGMRGGGASSGSAPSAGGARSH